MAQYNTFNVKLSHSQLNKSKSGTTNGTKVTLKLSSDVIGNSNDKTNFPHVFLLAYTQVSCLRKASPNNSSANIKLSRTELHKIGQSAGFLGSFLGPLLKSVSISLGFTAAALPTDAAIHKKVFGYGVTVN